MKCPSCGVDIERFEQERAKREKIAVEEAAFQRLHGEEIYKVRERDKLRGKVIGTSLSIFFILYISAFLHFSFLIVRKVSVYDSSFSSFSLSGLVIGFLIIFGFILLCLFIWFIERIRLLDWKGRGERELRKKFGLPS